MIKLRIFAALSGLFNKTKFILFGGVVTLFLVFGMSYEVYANENQEQVIVSPAQQAVNDALTEATTEVQQAITATETALVEVGQAQAEVASAQQAVSSLAPLINTATSAVTNVQTSIDNINNVDLSSNPINQSSQIVEDAKQTVITAQTAITSIDTATAQTEVSQITVAKSEAIASQALAQTELTQANIAIDSAQTAVNNLQATIGASTSVLINVDDAGVLMNLPFDLLMGGVLYENVYVGSNATITFGVNEGSNYYSTPNAPSVSIAGWDWTTWSTGTGITYATTESTLDIAWDLRPYPQQDATTQMAQIRFNADVNPVNGAWQATVTAIGPIPEQARFNYRETTNGTVTNIVDTNVGSGFAGELSQGPVFTPLVNNNTAGVQAAVDAANAIIGQLNQSLTPVVAQNTTNTSNINNINTTSLTNTINSAVSTKTNLQSILNVKASDLIVAINLLPQPPANNLNIENYDTIPELEVTDPDTEAPLEPTEDLQPEEGSEESSVEDEENLEEVEQPEEESEQLETEEQEQENQLEEPYTETITPEEEMQSAIEEAQADGVLTESEITEIAELLVESANGEAITAEEIAEAGIEYSDLPPNTPVEVRTDESGNAVIITADVAAALVLLESPSEFIGAIFNDPGQAMKALASIGADMSDEERKESQEMVVAAIIASGAAINAVSIAGGAASGSSTGGRGSGGGGPSVDSKGVRRRKS